MHALSLMQRAIATNARLQDIHLVLGEDEPVKARLEDLGPHDAWHSTKTDHARQGFQLACRKYLLCYNATEDRLSTQHLAGGGIL